MAMLEREDAPTMLRHAAALAAGVRAGCVRFVDGFCDKGFCAKLRRADMCLVYHALMRLRFVGGGSASRRMLSALARAHLRDSASYRRGYGGSWKGLFSVAACLGHQYCLVLAFAHVATPGWDRVSWGSASDESAGQGLADGAERRVGLRWQMGCESEDGSSVGVDGASSRASRWCAAAGRQYSPFGWGSRRGRSGKSGGGIFQARGCHGHE